MIDLHNHLLPAVDDGATELAQTRAALTAMRDSGVTTVVVTPHFDGHRTRDAEELAQAMAPIDAAWRVVQDLVRLEFPGLRLARGAEVMLDTPDPDLSDPRVRLAGSHYVLVEFPQMTVPPHSVDAIFKLRMQGWRPVVAHPERYHGLDQQLHTIGEWRRVGALLQVNSGSLLGRYGSGARGIAWRLLRRGWADLLASDYHARGRYDVAEARASLEERGGAEAAHLLLEGNPARLLRDEELIAVPPLSRPRRSFWQRIRFYHRGRRG